LAFCALKAIPGFAEGLSPVLGGVTVRDRGDLLGLVVLVPMWRLLRGRPRGSLVTERRESALVRVRCAAAASSILPLVGVLFAVLASTATSCAPRAAVVRIVWSGNRVFAEIERGYPASTWARSDDGGRTWSTSERPAEALAKPANADFHGDPAPRGPLEACSTDGTCYRLRDQHIIERTNPDGSSTAEFKLTDHEFEDISTGCAGPHRGVLGSVAASSGGVVVASLGAEGVAVREPDGQWEQSRVLDVRPPRRSISRAVGAVELVVGAAFAAGVLLVSRRRWPSWRAAVAIAFCGWIATMFVLGVGAILSAPGEEDFSWTVAPVGQAVTVIAAIVVGRSRWFAPRPRGPLPPPMGHL
jgi:hypothetical protein